jgi:hypothetical protein
MKRRLLPLAVIRAFDDTLQATRDVWHGMCIESFVRLCFRADQPMEAQIKLPSKRSPQGRGNPVGLLDCHVASLLAMTIGLI